MAEAIFNDEVRIQRWRGLTASYGALAVRSASPPDASVLEEAFANIPDIPAAAVATREHETGHDVVAFLQLVEEALPPEARPYLHLGLTSSDLVENGHFLALQAHASYMHAAITGLTKALSRIGMSPTLRAGRTHGQIAAHTSIAHQWQVREVSLRRIQAGFNEYASKTYIKSPGPTGKSPHLGTRGLDLARGFNGYRLLPSTQVIHRDLQLEWASLYLRLACTLDDLALQIRLGARAEVGEFREGAERVGSSAMPAKHNPIDSEKVCGLARVARGLFSSIAEGVALWEDRDLTNSSMERIAVPDLASLVEYMLGTMIKVINNLDVDWRRLERNARDPRTMAHYAQYFAQLHFKVGPTEASRIVKTYVNLHVGLGTVDTEALARYLVVDKEAVREWWREVREEWESHFE